MESKYVFSNERRCHSYIPKIIHACNFEMFLFEFIKVVILSQNTKTNAFVGEGMAILGGVMNVELTLDFFFLCGGRDIDTLLELL